MAWEQQYNLIKYIPNKSFISIPKENVHLYWSSIPPRKLMEQPMLYGLTWVWIEGGLVHFVVRGGIEIHTDRSIVSGGEFERVLVGTLQRTKQTFRTGRSTRPEQSSHAHHNALTSMISACWHLSDTLKRLLAMLASPHFVWIHLCFD
jgi:hypothetical protein